MSFQPVIPVGGLAGWRFLKRTLPQQTAAFDTSATLRRETERFEARIGSIRTADDLVADRGLLRVALGAFGLEADLNSRAFVRAVLDGGTLEPDALANRLADDRYRDFSRRFGFGDFPTPGTVLSDFGPKITARYRRQQFETAVGAVDQTMRLALNADRGLAEIAGDSGSASTKWFRILGSPPLRQVVEGALGLPAAFARLDIDRQQAEVAAKARDRLGIDDPADLADSALRERLIERFVTRAQLTEGGGRGGTDGASVALALLRASQG